LFFIAADRGLWRVAIRYFVIFIMIIVGSLIVNRLVFGDFLPLPFFVKAHGFNLGYMGALKWNPMSEMLLFWTAVSPFLVVIVATTSKKITQQLIPIALLITITFAYFGTTIQIMGWNARYYYPSLPFIVFAAFLAVFSYLEVDQIPDLQRTAGFRLLLGLMILMFVISEPVKSFSTQIWEKNVIGKPSEVQSTTLYQTRAEQPLPKLGWWNSILAISNLIQYFPQGTVLAASEYGYIGSQFPDLTIVDLVGLHDRYTAYHGFNADYLMSKKPDVVWLPHEDYTYVVSEIIDHPTFRLEYEYYPGVYDFGIGLWKYSKEYPQIKRVFNNEFIKVYSGLRVLDYLAEPVQ
jgi:hypothetical protein